MAINKIKILQSLYVIGEVYINNLNSQTFGVLITFQNDIFIRKNYLIEAKKHRYIQNTFNITK